MPQDDFGIPVATVDGPRGRTGRFRSRTAILAAERRCRMTRPRALDLFCGAGGAAMRLHRAGFDVVGVDIKRQPRYPFQFIQGDALALPVRLEDFDLVWASPPCQAHTALSKMWNAREHVDRIPETRALLVKSGVPYVIENVPGAPLKASLRLCGTMFDLRTPCGAELRRHRYFESSFLTNHGGTPAASRAPATLVFRRRPRRSAARELTGARAPRRAGCGLEGVPTYRSGRRRSEALTAGDAKTDELLTRPPPRFAPNGGRKMTSSDPFRVNLYRIPAVAFRLPVRKVYVLVSGRQEKRIRKPSDGLAERAPHARA